MNKFNEDMCEKIIAIAKRIVAPDYEEELKQIAYMANRIREKLVRERMMEHNVKILHLGADFLPKGSDLLGIQKSFLKKEFKAFYLRCQEQGIMATA